MIDEEQMAEKMEWREEEKDIYEWGSLPCESGLKELEEAEVAEATILIKAKSSHRRELLSNWLGRSKFKILTPKAQLSEASRAYGLPAESFEDLRAPWDIAPDVLVLDDFQPLPPRLNPQLPYQRERNPASLTESPSRRL